MTPPPSRPLWQGRTLALVGVVLLAFSLRSAVASLSPVLAEVQEDFAVPAGVAGLIGMAPPVCFALLGAITPRLERRFGLERLAVAAMLALGIATLARALAPNAGVLLATTVALFAAAGVGNVVTPPLVKVYFPDRIGTMTAVYSTTLAISAFVPPLVAVPVADATNWRFSLGMWSVFALAAAWPWIALTVGHRAATVAPRDLPDPRAFARMPRVRVAWALTMTFAASAAIAYTGFAWIPAILTQLAGVSHATAGALLSLFGAVGLPLSIVVPVLVTRWRRVGWLYAVAVVAGLAGIAGLVGAPTAAPALWVVLFGMPQLLFPLVLVLVQLRAQTHAASVALSAFAQSGGYAVAALFPLAFGLIHDATGSWTPALLTIATLLVLALPAGAVVARGESVEQEWKRRRGVAW